MIKLHKWLKACAVLPGLCLSFVETGQAQEEVTLEQVFKEAISRRSNQPEFGQPIPRAFDALIQRRFRSPDGLIFKSNPPREDNVIDIDTSLFIRDEKYLSAITFTDVMKNLSPNFPTAATAVSPGVKSEEKARALFKQWWGILGPKQSAASNVESSPTCRSHSLKRLGPFNCIERLVDLQNNPEKFVGSGASGLILVAAVNRPDLMKKEEPRSCGEFRLVFQTPLSAFQHDGYKLSISIEAKIIHGVGESQMCFAIQRFWQNLSLKKDDPAKLASDLKAFFLDGVTLTPDGFLAQQNEVSTFAVGPAISVENLGGRSLIQAQTNQEPVFDITDNPTGQIRTNIQVGHWVMSEFQFAPRVHNVMVPRQLASTVAIDVLTVKPSNMGLEAVNSLFLKKAKEKLFLYLDDVEKMKNLTGGDLGTFGFSPDLATLSFQSLNSKRCWSNLSKLFVDEKCAEKEADESVLLPLKQVSDAATNLSFAQLANRMNVLTCAGCHNWSGQSEFNDMGNGRAFPQQPSDKFQHIENPAINGRFPISSFLKEFALERRKRELQNYLANKFHIFRIDRSLLTFAP